MSEFIKGAIFFGLLIFFSAAGAAILNNISEGQKECSVNTDCSGEMYCGSDFKCHAFPQVTVVKNNFAVPAAILGIAIVLTAFILRKKHDQ